MPDDKKEILCSFCGSSQKDVGIMVAGPTANICNNCTKDATEAMQENMNRMKIKDQTAVPSPREINEFLGQYVIGQENARRTMAVAVHNHYIRLQEADLGSPEVELDKSNIMLIGPSGTGKTHIARALARMIDVPFVIADATALTEAGYVGEDADSIVSKLLMNANYDVEKASRGIIYIDEIDKITRKGDGPSLTRDVSGEGVQQALLKLIEGTVANITPNGGRKNPDQPMIQVDTTNILFICGGAFPGLEKIISGRKEQKSMGFGAFVDNSEERDIGEVLQEVTPDDLAKYGMIPEFIGRIPVVATLNPLSEEDMMQILTEPKNAIVKQFTHLFSKKNIELEFREDGLREIAKLALTRNTGARGLRSLIEKMLMETMYDLPDIAGETIKIEITKDVVNGVEKPIRVPRPDNDDEKLKEAV